MHKNPTDRTRQRLFGHIAAMATLIGVLPSVANATPRNVPGAYPNIQAAINAAANGDTVVVAGSATPYSGAGNVDIDTLGKAITIQGAGAGSTTIDVGASSANEHQAFTIHSGETLSTVIQGFTIENGYQGSGGAINITNANPTITQCIFLNNTASGAGGAIYVHNGGATISQCVFSGNLTGNTGDFAQLGGAIELINVANAGTLPKTVTLVNDSFINNAAGADGAAVDITGVDSTGNNQVTNNLTVTIDNCSFSKNTSHDNGNGGTGGAIDFFGGKATISNCILYGDTNGHEFSAVNTAATGSTIQYSDIQGGYTGTGAGSGIINIDPDYDAATSEYLRVESFSPTINAGTQVSTSPSGDRLNDTRDAHIDMGAYEYAFSGSVSTISPNQGSAFSGQIASFTDTEDDQTPVGSFTATINWGDGTITSGTINQSATGQPYTVSGSHTYTTSGSENVQVTITDSNPVSPQIQIILSGTETVTGATATGFTVSAPANATAGTAFNYTVTATNSFGTTTNYSGTVHFTSTDGAAVLPANATLTNGVGTFSATLKTAGSQTITATDTVTSSITGTSNAIAVAPGAATRFGVSAPSTATAGIPISFTTTAEDAFGNVATGYSGTVHFTTSDRYGSVPADTTLTNGAGTFSATLTYAVGTQTITATDTLTTSITGTSDGITVIHGPAAGFGIRVRSTTVVDGAPFAFNVYAYDNYGNQVTNYASAVHFTSTDPNAVLPADSPLTNGQGSFNATLYALGSQSITVTGATALPAGGIVSHAATVSGSLTVTVVDNPAVRFRMSASPATSTAGAPTTVTVIALDAAGNTARGYTGTVHLSSNSPNAVLPSNATLTNGSGTFQITFTTVGRYTITATDLNNSSITGTSGTVIVSAGPATQLKVTTQASAVTGKPFGIVVQALDAYGNIATGYAGMVHVTSSDPNAILPADTVLYYGQKTVLVTLKTLGDQTVTVTDTANAGLTATTTPVTITAH